MKWMFSAGAGSLLFSSLAFAAPTDLSGPIPAIAPSYGAGITSTVIYTVTNSLPLAGSIDVSGISGPVTRTTVADDCGNQIAKGPSSCKIGIAITPTASQIGSSINQTLNVSVNGKKPLTSAISFKVSNAYAYTANFYNNTVTMCSVNPATGLFTADSCKDSGVGAIFSGPVDILVRSFANKKFAYVSNLKSGFMSKCTVDSITGQLSSCGDSGAGNQFKSIYGMAFYNTTNRNTYLYVANSATDQVFQCPVNTTNGLLGPCADSGAGAVFPGQYYVDASLYMAFNSTGGATWVYVTEGDNGSNLVTKCLVDVNTGKFSACTNLNVGFPPSGIAFTQIGNQSTAYIVDFYYGNLHTCSVDSQDGHLSCGNPVSGGWWAQITLAKIGGRTLLYSANGFGSSNVSQCLIDPQTSALSACQDSGVGMSPFSAPFSIAFS